HYMLSSAAQYTSFAYTALFRSGLVLVVLGALVVAADLRAAARGEDGEQGHDGHDHGHDHHGGPRVAWLLVLPVVAVFVVAPPALDRKSTRLNSSHVKISYAVIC